MAERTTVCVAGAGPVGLHAAALIRQNGFPVTVLEEDSEVGKPTNCSGLISASGVRELGLDISSCIVADIYGANIYSPSGIKLEVRMPVPVAKLVDRYKFDKMFEEKAIKAGVEIKRNSKFLDMNNGVVYYTFNKRGERLKTDILVGSDGAKSTARKLVGFDPKGESFIHSYQETVQGTFEPGIVELYFGAFAHGLFAWIIPSDSKTAKVGIGVKLGELNPAQQLEKFKQHKGFDWQVLGKESFLIPWDRPLPLFQKDNILLVGDAAFQTKATTGGGLMLGLECAEFLAETVVEHMKGKKKGLEDYGRKCSKIRKELEIHNKVSKYIYGLSDAEIDIYFRKLKKAGIESFLEEHGHMDKPSKFAGNVLAKPGFWQFIPTAMKILF